LHQNIPARTYTNGIHRLFLVEGDQKKIKRVTQPSPLLRTPLGTWASSNIEKAHAFTNHLANVFQPHPSENQQQWTKHLRNFSRPRTNSHHQSIVLKTLKFKKSSTASIQKNHQFTTLSLAKSQSIAYHWNKISYPDIQCCLTQRALSVQWKVAQTILLLKPGKPHNELTSYRSTSLLPKVFEKILLKRLLPLVENNSLIPNISSDSGRHSTREQTHRVVQRINEALENKYTVLHHFSTSLNHSIKYGTQDFCTS
jgi:hypothetical protein